MGFYTCIHKRGLPVTKWKKKKKKKKGIIKLGVLKAQGLKVAFIFSF